MEDCENVYCLHHSINFERGCDCFQDERNIRDCPAKQIYDSVENEKGQSEKSLRFPTLEQCFDNCLKSVTDKKLSPTDEHMIGTTWAFIDGRLRR